MKLVGMDMLVVWLGEKIFLVGADFLFYYFIFIQLEEICRLTGPLLIFFFNHLLDYLSSG